MYRPVRQSGVAEMKNRTFLVNILLTVEVFAVCAAVLLTETFAPSAMLPKVSIPILVLLAAVPLAVEHYVGAPSKRSWIASVVLAGLTFAMGAIVTDVAAWVLFLLGGTVFAVVAVVYTSMCHRMKSGLTTKTAPAVNALLLFLAAQFFQGIL